MASSRLISIDLGNGFTKVRAGKRRFSFPSVIAVEDDTTAGFEAVGLASNHDFVIGYHDKRWAIGETVLTHGLMPVMIAHRSRITTEYYQILFAAALASAFTENVVVSPVVSLPPAAYWDKDKQKEMIAGEYTVTRAGIEYHYRVPYEYIRVVPEGFGTAALFCLDPRGQVTDSDLFEREVGIVDVGTYTTDFVQLSNMKVVKRGTDSIPHALSNIHKLVRTYAASQGVDIDVHEADEVLRKGCFLLSGRREALTEHIQQWSVELAQVIAARIRTLWGGGDAVELILVTGGGCSYVADLLFAEWPHVQQVTRETSKVEPWEANCEGCYRYGRFLQALETKSRK
ncbi:MAG: ParM/StbA family protein [Anaerolineae bacterium]